jgi:hypothetical protein
MGYMSTALLVDDGHDKIIFNAKVLLFSPVTHTSGYSLLTIDTAKAQLMVECPEF